MLGISLDEVDEHADDSLFIQFQFSRPSIGMCTTNKKFNDEKTSQMRHRVREYQDISSSIVCITKATC